MLRSSNPILSRQDAFTPAAPPQDNQNPYGQPQAGYSQYPGYPQQSPVGALEGRMTLDDVVTKTAVTIGVLVVAAALAWKFVPDTLYFPATQAYVFDATERLALAPAWRGQGA